MKKLIFLILLICTQMDTLVPIPRAIYESIQDVLQYQIDSLARDIAKTLDVNEKILLHEIRKEKIGIYLIDNDCDLDIKCKSYVNKNGHIYIRCDEPVIYNTNLCPTHSVHPIHFETIQHHTYVSNIVINDTKYYIDTMNKVYDEDLNPVGIYKRNSNKLIVLRKD